MQLNGWGDRCEILHGAGAEESGVLHMEATAGNNIFTAGSEKSTTLQVDAVRGDDLVKTYGPFNLLKVDVEGFEKQVLMGCPDILSQRPRLAYELHLALMGDFGASVGDIFDLIDVGH